MIVEDEASIRRFVRVALQAEGWQVHEAGTVRQGLIDAGTRRPDLVILDLGLPDDDGVHYLKDLRTWSGVPVIVLSARSDEADKIAALDAGADDYLTKPFSNRELVARVQTVLRRPRRPPAAAPAVEEHRVFGDLRIDAAGHEVWIGDHPVALTRTEFDILDVLSAQPRLALSRRQLIDAVWDTAWVGDEHVVDVHVANLRKKLDDDPTEPRYITTIRGVGYRMGRG